MLVFIVVINPSAQLVTNAKTKLENLRLAPNRNVRPLVTVTREKIVEIINVCSCHPPFIVVVELDVHGALLV